MKTIYITTTLPYVNADPHIGFAGELVGADALVRFKRLTGNEVFFNTGTDEHGIKIYRKAIEVGDTPQEYTDRFAKEFQNLKGALGLVDDINFIRTTDPHHVSSAQEFWRRCAKNGFIYKKQYKVKYCVGCELEKTDSELVDGKCPIHPKQDIEFIEEENYFFKFSAFQEKLLKLYEERPDFVVPDFRFNEIKAFVARGLEDFSISRLKTKMPWGVPVPNDNEHVMYVWFDALVSYISVIGWPDDESKFNKWWNESGGVIQFAGKDNLRQQSAMWQAMLMSVGISPSKQIVIRGFVTAEGGQKMSKSAGNVINPHDLVREYGTDAVRYFLLREINPFEDSPVTLERIKESYNSGLANGLGNLVSRVMKMAETHLSAPVVTGEVITKSEYIRAFESYDFKSVADSVWEEIASLDCKIQETAPFKLIKTDKTGGEKLITELVTALAQIGNLLAPIMPETSKTIIELIKTNKSPSSPLFLRKS